MGDDQRIEQFKAMAEADPDNELGHFSLGKAYLGAGRYGEAEPCFARVLQLNPAHSKTYQLLGQAQSELGKRDEAIKTLQRGYEVAAQCGDVMPRDAIAKLLGELGEAIPKTSAAPTVATSPDADDGSGFRCKRCGRPSGKLPERPFKGELGEKVWAHICSDCWREWVKMGTMVINEMSLQLADPRSQDIYDQQMKEFLKLED